MNLHHGIAGLLVAGALVIGTPGIAGAQERPERERADQRERVERERAEHRERAQGERREREHAERREHEQRERLMHVLEGLEHGMAALAEINRHEERLALARVADAVRRELGHGPEREHDERAVAHRRFEINRMAVEHLVKGERHDAADLMERAAHAMRMSAEGRNDPEARQVRERAPELGAQIELLMLASKIAREHRQGDRAEVMADLAGELRARWERQRQARPDRAEPERREREADRRAPDLGARLERLEERMGRLEQMIERLAGAIRERSDR